MIKFKIIRKISKIIITIIITQVILVKKKTTHIHQVIQKMKMNHKFIYFTRSVSVSGISNNKTNKMTHWIVETRISLTNEIKKKFA